MTRWKNILFAFTGSEAGRDVALARAAAIAAWNDAQLTVAGVLEAQAAGPPALPGAAAVDPVGLAKQELTGQLDALVEPLRGSGLRLQTTILAGKPFLEIIRAVLREGHDLVVVPAEGPGGWKRALFGSTSMHLMRKCPCPVWVAKGRQGDPIAKVMAAVDPDRDERPDDALNLTILQLATSMAAMEGAELHVVHVWSVFGETLLAGRGGLSKEQLRQVIAETGRRSRERLKALMAGFDLEHLRCTFCVRKGDPGTVIPVVAARVRPAVLIMGTLSRSGVAGFFMGNTAETVLSQVDCSVLTVKPAAFVAPVKIE